MGAAEKMSGTELAVVPTVPVAQVHNSLMPRSINDAMDLAKLMASASLVPQHLQGKAADCFLVIEQAMRWGMSPFAVAQCTSSIKGKLMFEGKLVAAVINGRGDLDRRLDYEYTGDGDRRTVRVFGRVRGEAEDREVTVAFKDARTDNAMWRSQPDQQLMYHGARVWARRHMPELMLGIYSPEEMKEEDRRPPVPVAVERETSDPVRAEPAVAKATLPQRKKFFALAGKLIGAGLPSVEQKTAIRQWAASQLGITPDPEWSSNNISADEMARLISELEAIEHDGVVNA